MAGVAQIPMKCSESKGSDIASVGDHCHTRLKQAPLICKSKARSILQGFNLLARDLRIFNADRDVRVAAASCVPCDAEARREPLQRLSSISRKRLDPQWAKRVITGDATRLQNVTF